MRENMGRKRVHVIYCVVSTIVGSVYIYGFFHYSAIIPGTLTRYHKSYNVY